MTKILIPLNKPVKIKELTFDDISERFARAPFILIIEDNKERVERNIERALAEKGVGRTLIEKHKPDIVIARSIGENAKAKLLELGAKIYIVSSEKELEKVLKELKLR